MRSFLLVWSKLSATGSLAMLGLYSGITISLHCTRKTVSHSSPDTSQFAKQDSLPWDLPHFIINPYLPMYIYIYICPYRLFLLNDCKQRTPHQKNLMFMTELLIAESLTGSTVIGSPWGPLAWCIVLTLQLCDVSMIRPLMATLPASAFDPTPVTYSQATAACLRQPVKLDSTIDVGCCKML